MRIGIIAGESSGDMLAAGFIRLFKAQYPHIEFIGITGPKMEEAGCESLASIDELAVMGFTEIFLRLPSLLRLRKRIIQIFLDRKIDAFIGFDAPDFNLSVELKLKKAGIKTIHYNSPKVWAWRQYRVHKIKKAVDLMLTLFPFEKDFYARFDLPAYYIGHPLADDLPDEIDTLSHRRELHLPLDKKIIALLPGSRVNELHYHADVLMETAKRLSSKIPDLHFVIPMVNQARYKQMQEAQSRIIPELSVTYVLGQSQKVMMASDVVCLSSGTATLECVLLKKPMVVLYKTNRFNYWLAKKLVKVPFISLPNIIANERLVPELIQDDAHPDALASACVRALEDEKVKASYLEKARALHERLKCGSYGEMVKAVSGVLGV